jgi:UTP--glucose-1-phosphate uridylyltransferase
MKKLLLCTLFIFTIFATQNIVNITKVIVPMAGLGTRLLPFTKSVSKSMMPLVDKPALQHVVEEALQSHINDFCFVVNEHEQQIIEHYFSRDLVLDAILKERKKIHFVAHLNDVIEQSQFTYIVQPKPLGLGHAVLMGEQFVEPGSFFCVMLPDNIIESQDPHMAQLIAIAQQYNASVITIEEISREKASQYAVVTPKAFLTDDLIEVADIVEKPVGAGDDSLCFGQIGRQVLAYDVFESLKAIEPGVGGELQLTDAVRHMVQQGKRVLAYKLQGKRHDIGNVRGLLKTSIILGLHNPLYCDMLRTIFMQEMG